MVYTCDNLGCASRQVEFDPQTRRWVHLDTGLVLCDPAQDTARHAMPKPPEERLIATPAWFVARQSGP